MRGELIVGPGPSESMRPIDFEQAWRDQQDLGVLCSPRPLETREILVQNAFYGSDRVLKTYAGLPDDYPLKMVIPHGISSEDLSHIAPLERLPIVTYSYAEDEAMYREAGIRNALWPLAMPYAYAVELARRTLTSTPARRGTLFFPSHSIASDVVEHDVDGIVSTLRALPEKFLPITVCIYFFDYMRGLGTAFERAGFPVVSAGNNHDPQFMIRLHHLLAAHRFAASDDVGSCCYYSMYSGCIYRHLDASAGRDDAPSSPRLRMLVAELRRLSVGDPSEQRSAAMRVLGADKLLSPEELRAQILAAECVDRWGVRVVQSQQRMRLRIERPWRPWLLRRWVLSRAGMLD